MTLTQAKARKYILSCIDSEPYEIKTRGEKQKLQFLYDTFQHEMKWNIDRIGQYKAFTEWCMGLPTVFGIEFENYKIIELAKKWGTLAKDATEKQEDRILENYWNLVTVTTFQLFKKNKITV